MIYISKVDESIRVRVLKTGDNEVQWEAIKSERVYERNNLNIRLFKGN